jgi:hypothetical protein
MLRSGFSSFLSSSSDKSSRSTSSLRARLRTRISQFEMHCFGVAVLRVLDQKHHEKGDDRRGGVDDQLPGIRKMNRWSGENPDKNYEHGSSKSPGRSRRRSEKGGRRREMHRVLCKRNPAPFPASLAFRFGFALPHRLNFARNPKNGRKQSQTSVSRSIPSQSPPLASSRSHVWRRESLSLQKAIPFWFAISSLLTGLIVGFVGAWFVTWLTS